MRQRIPGLGSVVIGNGKFQFCTPSLTQVELKMSQRMVPCALKCGKDVVDNEVDFHRTKICLQRLSSCILNCGATFCFEQLEAHMKEDCPNRGVVCHLCGDVVIAKHLEAHIAGCEYRHWTCPKCGEGVRIISQAANTAIGRARNAGKG
jgi:hypothetical protein